MATCECPVESKTIYREHFKKYSKIKPAQILKTLQKDKEILTGYAPNNLKVNGRIVTTKVWPNILTHAEEYENFLKRFKSCKYTNEVFQQNFECPPVQIDIIDDMIRNLGKSVYQITYSPNEFTPKKEKMRFAKLTDTLVNTKYYETTYRTFYDSLWDFEHCKDKMLKADGKSSKADELRNALRNMCTCGKSTYQDMISFPGKLHAKVTPTPPIDRYTLRKI